MNTTRTASLHGHTASATRTGTAFISFYSQVGASDKWMFVEHRSENAARKGSWQSPAMKAIWVYTGYAPVK